VERSVLIKNFKCMELKAKEIIQVYRGAKALEEEKTNKVNKGFQDRGFIMLRPGERLKFSTGYINDTDDQVVIYPSPNIVEEKGLLLSSALTVRQPGEEFNLVLFNPTKYLIEIEKDEVIALI